MKDKSGALNTIVEVPSEQSNDSFLNHSHGDEDEEIQSDYQELGSDDQIGSQFSNESLDEAENMKNHTNGTQKKTKRRPNRRSVRRTGKKHTPRPEDIDMTPPNELLETAERRAKRFSEKKEGDDAIYELIRCTALCRILYGDSHWKKARSHARLAEGYLDLKGYAPQAEEHAAMARQIMMSVQMSSSPNDKHRILETLVSLHFTMGRAQAQQKKYTEAENAIEKAEQLHRDRSKLTEVPQDNITDWDVKLAVARARLSARQKKQASAQQSFEKALKLIRKRNGKDSVELISIYQSLGRVEQSKGEHADHEYAIEHYLQAYSIASARWRDGNETVAEALVGLASAYSNVGQPDADISAESYYNDASVIYQKEFGPHHEKTITVQDDLAKLMIRSDKQQEGIEALKSSMDAKKEVYGEYSAEMANTWKLIGNVYLSLGEMEKALRALKKCHNIECSVYGVNNKKSKDTQRTLDIIMANPNIPDKLKKTKDGELAERPRFNTIVNRGSSLGGFKSSQY